MNPALRKGPLFLQKNTPPFHFLPTGPLYNAVGVVRADTVLYVVH